MTFIFKDKKKKGYLQEGKSIDIPYCYQDKVVAPYTTPESLKFIREYFSNFGDTTKGVLGKIYFAHPESRWQSKREEMITRILEKRGYEVINPFDRENELLKKYKTESYYKNPSKTFADEIVKKDRKMCIEECESYFGWFPKKSMAIGTAIEMDWAYIAHKYIIVLIDKPQPFCWNYCDILYLGYNNFKNDVKFYERR